MSLRHGDLKDTIFPLISLDEFDPKSGKPEEVVVIGFYAKDDDPARDFNTFVQRGSVDVLDTEVSPNPDELGRYLIFVELERNEIFPETFKYLVKDIENLTGKMDWKVKPYLTDEAVPLTDPALDQYFITDPELYMPKSEFKLLNTVSEALQRSDLSGLTYSGPYAIMSAMNCVVAGKIVDAGSYTDVTNRNQLGGSPILFAESVETNSLRKMLGSQWNVVTLEGKGTALTDPHRETTILLTDLQYVYRTV
jgi:hypothetical protein